MPTRDDAYHEALEAAMLRLAGVSRDDAELVLERFEDGSMEFRAGLQRALQAAGHADLAEQVNADLEEAWAERRKMFEEEDFEATERWLLTAIGELAAPAPLTQLELRRVDALADFVASAALAWVWAGWALRRAEALSVWIAALADLGGFDRAVLSAQAHTILQELDAGNETAFLSHDGGVPRDLRQWSRVADPERCLSGLVSAIGLLPRQASQDLFAAIGTAPDRRRAVGLLEARLTRVKHWARVLVARILVVCESQIPETGTGEADARAATWLDDPDPLLRRAAAMWWGHRAGTPGRGAELERCLGDRDAGVVETAVHMLRPEAIDDRLRSRLVDVRAITSRGWTCTNCGHGNPPGPHRGCDQCSTSGPQPGRGSDRLARRRPGERAAADTPRPAPEADPARTVRLTARVRAIGASPRAASGPRPA